MNASILLLVLLERTKNTIKLKKKIGLDLFRFVTVFFVFLVSYIFSRHFTRSSEGALGLNSFGTVWYARNVRKGLVMRTRM